MVSFNLRKITREGFFALLTDHHMLHTCEVDTLKLRFNFSHGGVWRCCPIICKDWHVTVTQDLVASVASKSVYIIWLSHHTIAWMLSCLRHPLPPPSRLLLVFLPATVHTSVRRSTPRTQNRPRLGWICLLRNPAQLTYQTRAVFVTYGIFEEVRVAQILYACNKGVWVVQSRRQLIKNVDVQFVVSRHNARQER